MGEKPRWSYRKLVVVFLALVILVPAAFIAWRVYEIRQEQRAILETLKW